MLLLQEPHTKRARLENIRYILCAAVRVQLCVDCVVVYVEFWFGLINSGLHDYRVVWGSLWGEWYIGKGR